MNMATPMLVLLPSPLLGRAIWEPVAGELADRGWPVSAIAATGSAAGPAGSAEGPSTVRAEVPAPQTPDDVLDAFLNAVPADRDVVLVSHSNAGLYVPALVRHRRVAASVFVDAALPPLQGETPLAPAALYDLLVGKADDDGVLPVWTLWWDEADVAALFPSDEVWERVEREQARLPLSYFSSTLPVPEGWSGGLPAAYLAFGDTYAEERDQAAGRGWPTSTLPGRHLHMLVDPPQVADEIDGLLRQCLRGVVPRRGRGPAHPEAG